MLSSESNTGTRLRYRDGSKNTDKSADITIPRRKKRVTKRDKGREREESKVRSVPRVPSPSSGGVQWRLIRNQGCGPTLPDSLSTMPLSFEKKEEGVKRKKGPIATYMQICILKHRYHLHSDASLWVGCILRYFRFTMASLPPQLILGGRDSNESPKHCLESIPTPHRLRRRADYYAASVSLSVPRIFSKVLERTILQRPVRDSDERRARVKFCRDFPRFRFISVAVEIT